MKKPMKPSGSLQRALLSQRQLKLQPFKYEVSAPAYASAVSIASGAAPMSTAPSTSQPSPWLAKGPDGRSLTRSS